jgi:exosortase/archaeosortase family protein
MKKNVFFEKLVAYKGVFYFFIILLVAHFFWKFTMLGDESDNIVIFFGLDLSNGFNAMATHVAEVVYAVLYFLGYEVTLEPNNVITYVNGVAVRIVWACTGYKQAYIFTVIIAFYLGPWLRKLWYIPAGLVIVYLYNIFRIVAIVALIENNPKNFEFLHEGVFKYLYYGVIFLMWVLWEEKVRKSKLKKSTIQK